MRIVFLDIDGVLNNPGCYAIASGSRTPPDPKCIAALNLITEATGAVIVVSSTWRISGLMFCKEHLHEWGVKASIVDRTPILREMRGSITISQPRGFEIAEWLNKTHYEIESYVILDDDPDMAHLKKRLVQTEGHVGLTFSDAARAIAMLEVPVQKPVIVEARS